MSLLSPKLIVTEIPPLIGIKSYESNRFSNVLFYSWTTDQDEIGNSPLIMTVGDDFLSCWTQFSERFSSMPGTSRVFPLKPASHRYYNATRTVSEMVEDFDRSVPHLSGWSSTDTPWRADIVVTNKPVITSDDPSTILDLVIRYGNMPAIDDFLPDDPTFPVVLAKTTFHPGSLPLYMPDPDGRIRARRSRSVERASHNKYPFHDVFQEPWDSLKNALSKSFTAFLLRLKNRGCGLHSRSPFRTTSQMIQRYYYNDSRLQSTGFTFDSLSNSVRHGIPPISSNLSISDFYAVCTIFQTVFDHEQLLLHLCRNDRVLRDATVHFCLTYTGVFPTLHYITDVLREPTYRLNTPDILRLSFAVARVLRNLHPTLQEIHHVRSDQPVLPDPDPHFEHLRRKQRRR
jgi:hypothetical protein